MKRFIYITGTVSIIALFVGATFKISHWPGANWLLLMSFVTICLLFYPFAFYKSCKHEKKNKWIYITAFISVIIETIGAMFKIFHWPGANILMIIGIPLPFVLFLPVYIYYNMKTQSESVSKSIFVLLLMTYIAVMSVFLTLRPSKEVVNASLISSISKNNSTSIQDEIKNTIIIDKLNNGISDEKKKALVELNAKAIELHEYVQTIKKGLVYLSTKNHEALSGNSINVNKIYHKDYQVNIKSILDNSDLYDLNKLLNEYKNSFNKAHTFLDPQVQRFLFPLMHESGYFTNSFPDLFSNLPLASCLSKLTDFQNNISSILFIVANEI